MTKVPLDFFSESVDAWGAAEWFDRLAKAVRQQDAAVLANDKVVFEICRNVVSSSAMRLVRDYEQEVRTRLAAQSAAPVGTNLPICCVTGRIAGDEFACGDCDPCGAYHAVPDVVKSLIKERDEWADKYAHAIVNQSAATVVWIAFAGNGNVRFWTSDAARAESEKERGLDLRMFTLAELVALASRAAPSPPEVREKIEAIIQRANESGGGTMGLIDTIHAMHGLAREALAALPTNPGNTEP